MATQIEIHRVLTYISADLDFEVTAEKRAVWFDQFGDVSYEELFNAARIVLSKKMFAKFPKVADMWEGIREGRIDEKNWSEVWEKWAELARKHGYYERGLAKEELKKYSELGARSLGTISDEYFLAKTEDMPVLRAQFRQKYEENLKTKQKEVTTIPKLQLDTDGKLLSLVRKTTKQLTIKK